MNPNMSRMLPLAFVVPTPGIGIAHGKECKGVNFPDQAQVEGSSLALNGLRLAPGDGIQGKRLRRRAVCRENLESPHALLGASAPAELILQFVRNVGAGDLRKGWSEGFEKNSKDQLSALKERIATLNGWMADVKTGERMTFIRQPGVGVSVNVNGADKGRSRAMTSPRRSCRSGLAPIRRSGNQGGVARGRLRVAAMAPSCQ